MSEKSRGEFLKELRGPSSVAKELGIPHRQTVSNWMKQGFPKVRHQALIELAQRLGKEPHHELLQEDTPRLRSTETTPLRDFLHALKKAVGGFRELSKIACIPEPSLRKMCERKGELMPVHIQSLERVAENFDVALPDFWIAARDKVNVNSLKKASEKLLHVEGKNAT